ncbi:hypothetical protein [Sphingobacterium siyangense]|uniref:hypothetical protein n=1 Tax=Sphingobacterium siyangense TaxID=459529 RepID=UPI0028971DAC|nr:hypothetical protein [Sphingobacterium siyangense]
MYVFISNGFYLGATSVNIFYAQYSFFYSSYGVFNGLGLRLFCMEMVLDSSTFPNQLISFTGQLVQPFLVRIWAVPQLKPTFWAE